jgi:transcriptional regulator with XRE-family HTH domain
MDAAILGKRIRAARKALRYTQKQLAARLGVSGSTISSYELGDTLPSLDVIEKLADIGNVSYDWLLAGCYMAKEPGGKIIQLTEEEIILLKKFREAHPEHREAILKLLSAVAKAPRQGNK